MGRSSRSERIAKAVLRAMDLTGQTVDTVASATGISARTLRQLLDGDTPFTLAELTLVADVIGVPASSFLDAAGAPDGDRAAP